LEKLLSKDIECCSFFKEKLEIIMASCNIQRLIWFYFWLLIFEGALRKWVVPQFAAPLLIIRDPLVIGAYFLALKEGIFPKDIFTKAIIFLAFVSFLGGLATVITSDITSSSKLLVVIYGLRTNFLHLPFMLLIPKVFSLKDIKKLGRWVLLLTVPMAILMVYQFSSPPNAFINRGAGIDAMQIGSSLGKIRPPGIFSFTTGAAQYFSLVASFILYGLIQSKIYPNWLLSAAGLSLVLALAVSGSRTAVASVGIVLISLIVVFLVKPEFVGKSYKFLAFAVLVGFGVSHLPFFNQGVKVLSTRIEQANGVEASGGGIVSRFFGEFLKPFNNTDQIPPLGYGLGMGTAAGSALLTGKVTYLLAEGEWERVVLESGFVLGLLYILLRIGLIIWMGGLCVQSASTGRVLPLFIFTSCALLILNGQFGQPTTLGFAILGGGLCLASCQTESDNQAIPAIR